MVLVVALLVSALPVAFMFGRIWEIRQQILRRLGDRPQSGRQADLWGHQARVAQ
jgi:hypothetical protein